jgi:positive phototaxis protein PixI
MNNYKIFMAQAPSSDNLANSYLKFYLNPQTPAIIAMHDTQEAIMLSVESVTAMPNMPPCVLGLMTWRSRIIWVIDLPRMLNLESEEGRLKQYHIIVVQVESLLLGLVVYDIKGISKFMFEDIQSPVGQVASSLVPYLSGCVMQAEEILLVLDAASLVNSPLFLNN